MKKAIFVEPLLLADIKRKSPAIYEYYNNSFFTKHEFIDYGEEWEPMFMRLDVYYMLVNDLVKIDMTISDIMDMLQEGYRAGQEDLIAELCKPSYLCSFALTGNRLLNIALREDYLPDSERCALIKNNGRVFNKGTYCDGIFFQAWEQIFMEHAWHNDIFKQINQGSKKFDIFNDRKLDFGYPSN